MRLLRLGAFGLAVLVTLRRCGRPRFSALASPSRPDGSGPVDTGARQA